MHLSSLTCDALEATLGGQCNGSPRQSAALAVLMANSGCSTGQSDEQRLHAILEWIEREGGAAPDYSPIDHLSCHGTTVELARGMGVDARRLALCAEALDDMVVMDVGDTATDQRQIAVTPTGNGHRVTVPLSNDVYYDGEQILVRRPVPHTILVASIGRRAFDVISHPALEAAGIIASVGEPVADFEALVLERTALATWAEIGQPPHVRATREG